MVCTKSNSTVKFRLNRVRLRVGPPSSVPRQPHWLLLGWWWTVGIGRGGLLRTLSGLPCGGGEFLRELRTRRDPEVPACLRGRPPEVREREREREKEESRIPWWNKTQEEMSLATLWKELELKGGKKSDWDFGLSQGLTPHDLGWIDTVAGGVDSESFAEDLMVVGRLLEYRCYDNRGRDQGKAIIRILGWDGSMIMSTSIKAQHVVASDGYYEWYAQNTLKEEKTVYHVCPTTRKKCKEGLPKGDRRTLIHLMQWRMVNPMMMNEMDYAKASGLKVVQEWVKDFTPAPLETPAAPPAETAPIGGVGLDEALKQAQALANVGQGAGGPAPAVLKGSKAVGALLHAKAEKRRQEEANKKRGESKKARTDERDESGSRGRSPKKKKKKRRHQRKDNGRSESRSSSESLSFQEPPSRAGIELWRLSQQDPGKLLKSGMKELSRYLAERTGEENGPEEWMEHRVMAYINQVVLTQHPPQKIATRGSSLGTSLDLLLQGKLASLGDLLMQRLKAVETSLAENSWMSARHQELIPPQSASLTSMQERERAAKTELRMAKLREVLEKGKTK